MSEPEAATARRRLLQGAAALVLTAATGVSVAQSVRESRAILNEGYNWLDSKFAATMVARIADAGFNALITSVWHGAGTTWTSSVAPTALEFHGGDPVATLLDLTGRRGLELHAWFCVALRQREFLSEFRGTGTPRDKFEIHSPAFRAFIRDVILEFVRRYPVQGVNLDYVRAGGISVSGQAQDDYARRTGRTLLVDRALPTESARAAITQWQERAVGEIVQAASAGTRRLRPDVLLSVDAAPWYEPYRLEGQNSLGWADAELVDVVYSMTYQEHLDVQALDALKRTMKKPGALVPVVANYSDRNGAPVPRPAAQLASLLDQAREVSRDNGVGVYLYSMLNQAQLGALRSGPFRDPALPYWKRAGDAP